MYQYLELIKKDCIATIRFNRPKQMNAMNRKFMDEIIHALEDINDDINIRVGIITGNGRAFMAGADIKEYASQSEEDFEDFQKRGWRLYQLIENSKKPYIASVPGFALGGGFEILLACDLVVATEEAKMGLPEVHLGLVPGGGGTQRLIQKIGLNRAKEMLYFGGQYSAQALYQWGIVNYVVSSDKLEEKTQELAEKLSRRVPGALAELKKLAQLSLSEESFENRMKEEGKSVYKLFLTSEAKEKINEFIKKV